MLDLIEGKLGILDLLDEVCRCVLRSRVDRVGGSVGAGQGLWLAGGRWQAVGTGGQRHRRRLWIEMPGKDHAIRSGCVVTPAMGRIEAR